MKLNHWHGLLDHGGPYATVVLDTSRRDPAGAAEVATRWENARRELIGEGAPEAVAEGIAAVVVDAEPGPAGRLLVATEKDGVLLDVTLPHPPESTLATWGVAPVLLPGVRAYHGVTSYLLVRIDRAGADIELRGQPGEPVRTVEVEGDHDELRKVSSGGSSHLRYQHRAEDSWERNATEVAATVDRLFRGRRPELVLVAGEDHVVTHFLNHLGAAASKVTRRLGTGGRAEGTSAGALGEAVEAVLTEHRAQAQKELSDRFSLGEGRQDTAVSGLEDVVDVLRRGQADEILLQDQPSSTFHLWVGDEPLQLATREEDVRAMGAQQPTRVRADLALTWAALASDAGITLLDEDSLRLNDGIGAVLRWSDASTPREAVPSMPGHGEPRGGDSVR